jgi:hypothetical protein
MLDAPIPVKIEIDGALAEHIGLTGRKSAIMIKYEIIFRAGLCTAMDRAIEGEDD